MHDLKKKMDHSWCDMTFLIGPYRSCMEYGPIIEILFILQKKKLIILSRFQCCVTSNLNVVEPCNVIYLDLDLRVFKPESKLLFLVLTMACLIDKDMVDRNNIKKIKIGDK